VPRGGLAAVGAVLLSLVSATHRSMYFFEICRDRWRAGSDGSRRGAAARPHSLCSCPGEEAGPDRALEIARDVLRFVRVNLRLAGCPPSGRAAARFQRMVVGPAASRMAPRTKGGPGQGDVGDAGDLVAGLPHGGEDPRYAGAVVILAVEPECGSAGRWGMGR
jgi:hypothetical protein